MLVLRGDRQGIPETELKVLDWLRASDLAGVVVSGAQVQSSNRRHRGSRRWLNDSVEADLIVITPQACIVIEVKGIKKPVSGVLSCPVNGRWTMPGVDEPVNVRGRDTNPIDQAKEAMFGFKGLVDKASPGPGTFVLALVVVMPIPGYTVTLNPGEISMPPGCEILLAPHRDALHRWFAPEPRGAKGAFHRARAYRPEAPWTAERVMRVLDALMHTHDVTINDLTKHGFLTEQSIASGPPTPSTSTEAAPHDSAIPPLSSPVEPSSGPPTSSPHLQAVPETALDNVHTTAPHPDPAVRPPASSVEEDPASKTHPVRTLVLAAAALVTVGTALWGFAGCSSTNSQHDAPAPVETSSIAPTPPPEPAALEPPPAPLDEELLPETPPPPPPQQPAGCFPFQSNC
ncbi:NERD domain-containing protein [Nocardia higoensis]|uniref:NERD domain-containing protein n=1 Tax=Nocardia higoensis TaxID=228599 RepID=A0ABS0DII0_9NOCA|nr:nuclease-related domain-containing protein [Nocardia higoensis]MBF6358261.1 NERD domain-containing protein [Nocardia higoensis]